MSTITTRSGKGSPLTNNEVDANFTNLNTDKAELSGAAFTGAITTNSTFDGRDVATDGTKLDGIEANADVTDATNVTAAGALMDGELTAIASVKALNQGVATTDSPTFSNLTLSGTDSVKVPSGTTGQRNGSPANGMFRYNSTTAEFEGYQDGAWGSIGGGTSDITLSQFTGDGSDTTFTLSGLAAENNTFVFIDGVYQSKSNYSVSTADPAVVTFSTAPPNTTAIEVMVAAISVSNIGTPSDNTVSTAKIVDDAVTTAKIADDAVTSDKLAHSLDVVTDLSIGGASNGVEISNGAIALKNSGTQSKIDFYCESSNAHYTRIQAAPHSSYTGNAVLTLPASDGDAGQFLQTDGSGVMSWGGVSPTIHSYRYWRMTNFGEVSSGTYLGMWVFYDDYDGTGNVLAGGPNAVTTGITATASHVNADADHPLSANPFSYWNATTQALALQQTWIKYAFTSSKTVKSMSVAYRKWNGNTGFGGGRFQIEGSSDNTNWVRIHSVSPLQRSSSYFEDSYSTHSMENTFNLV